MRGFFGVLDFFCIRSVVVITRIYTSVETQRTVTTKSKFYCMYIEKLKNKRHHYDRPRQTPVVPVFHDSVILVLPA